MQQQLVDTNEPSKTLKKHRLCDNCGVEMQGTYCYRCGQASRHFIKFFPSVIREIFEDTFDIDGRFGRTIWTILFRPGRATIDFLHGKRVHYTPPFRLYFFTSVFAFLLLGFGVQSDFFNEDDDGVQTTQESPVSAEDTPAVPQITIANDELSDLIEDIAEEISDEDDDDNVEDEDHDNSDTNNRGGAVFGFTSDEEDELSIRFNEDEWNPTTNPIEVGWLPVSVNALLNQAAANIKTNVPRIAEDPSLLLDKIFQLLPQTLFVLLPIFALVLKLFYLFSKRYYMEHLIFSVHIHTFTLMILICAISLEMLEEVIAEKYLWLLYTPQAIIYIWAIIYSFLAQKRVYNQGWFLTLIKYNTVYFTYTIIQLLAISIVFVIGVTTL